MITLKQAPLTNGVCRVPPPFEYMFALVAAVAAPVGSSISHFLQVGVQSVCFAAAHPLPILVTCNPWKVAAATLVY